MGTTLQIEERTSLKHSDKQMLRKSGSFPAVIYGKKKDSQPVAINSIEFRKAIREVGRNGILTLDVKGNKIQVMVQDLQTDPIKSEIVHADFYVVDMSSEVSAEVNIHLVGVSVGVKSGGVLQQAAHQLKVTALPGNLPSAIEVDISNLDVSENVQVSDIKGNGKYTIDHDGEQVIASVLPPKVEKTVEAGETQSGEVSNEGTEGDESEK